MINQRIDSWFLSNWYSPSPSPFPWPLHALLSLGAWSYAKGLYHHQSRAKEHRSKLPAFVISVGNLVVGGTGKTPLTLWLAGHFHSLGWKPAILSRGYRRKDSGIARVPAIGDSGREVLQYGDESVLMARRAGPVPVWVGSNRCMAGYQAVENDGADLLILDDGFQHLALERDLDLALLDAANPFGNGRLLPLGPLREPPMHLDRADAILLTRAEDPERCGETRSRLAGMLPGKDVFSCTHRLTGLKRGLDGQHILLDTLRGRKVVAFSGIARPESFTQLLRKEGIVVSRSFAFPDHYQYLDADMVLLLNSMKASDTPFLVTTEKDMVRLRPEFQAFALAAVVELDFAADHQAFCDFLQERLSSR